MNCEFAQSSDNRQPLCRKIVALKAVMAQLGLEGVYTLPELMQLLCDDPDSQGREGTCLAFADLTANGRGSQYCK